MCSVAQCRDEIAQASEHSGFGEFWQIACDLANERAELCIASWRTTHVDDFAGAAECTTEVTHCQAGQGC